MKRFLLILTLLFMLTGCSSMQKYDTCYLDVFDTFSTFSCYTNSKKEFDIIANELHSYLTELNKKFDIYNSYEGMNNLKTINDNAGIKPVKVDSNILELISLGKAAYEDTNGTINIAMGSVLNIWHNYRENADGIPTSEELRNADEHSDINNIIIDEKNSTVFIKDKFTRIDVGALAKGYCGDKAKEFLIDKGAGSALLNLGGNVVCINDDTKPNWNIGIQDPDNDNGFIKEITVSNKSAVTSGNYQRFYEYNGKKYHHIIDTKTLMPADNNKSVTVLADNSFYADMLSTALFILPYNEGMKLAQKYDAKAIWVTDNNEIKEIK